MKKGSIIFVMAMGALFLATFLGFIAIIFKASSTVISGMIGFAGSLIGGALTLVGVFLTIKSSDRAKEKESLPEKLNHIELALEELENAINYELILENRDIKKMECEYVELNNILEIDYKEKQIKLVKKVPSNLKHELIFINANTYKLYLDFKEKLSKLDEAFYKVQSEVRRFKEKYKLEINSGGKNLKREIKPERKAKKYKVYLSKNDINLKGLYDIKKLLLKCDMDYHKKLREVYMNFHLQLKVQHEELINKLDK